MSSIWNWAQTKVGYFCLAFFGTLGVLELIKGHWWWAAMDLTAAVVFCFWYQCPRSPGRLRRKVEAIATDLRPKRPGGAMPPPPPGENSVAVVLSKGSEPVPTPGEENVGTSHRLGTDPTCNICASMQERP